MPTRRVILALLSVATLSACGADGAPSAPNPEPGVAMTGQVKVGMAGG